jgi:hypothetical protein
VIRVKRIGLVLVSAALACAALGTGTAAATELCSTATTPCSGTKYLSGNSMVAGLEGLMVISTNIDTIDCSESTLGAETTSSGGSGATVVSAKIESLTFTSCSDSFATPCTVTSEFLPTSISISGGKASETASFSVSQSSKLGIHVVCGALVSCTFYREIGTLFSGFNETGGHPALQNTGLSLSRTGGFCPSIATLSSSYEVLLPWPLFVV